MATLYCTFAQNTGWRVFGCTDDTDTKVQVVVFNGRKCLSIPAESKTARGKFCNPKKRALEFVRMRRVRRFDKDADSQVSLPSKMLGRDVKDHYRPYLH